MRSSGGCTMRRQRRARQEGQPAHQRQQGRRLQQQQQQTRSCSNSSSLQQRCEEGCEALKACNAPCCVQVVQNATYLLKRPALDAHRRPLVCTRRRVHSLQPCYSPVQQAVAASVWREGQVEQPQRQMSCLSRQRVPLPLPRKTHLLLVTSLQLTWVWPSKPSLHALGWGGRTARR